MALPDEPLSTEGQYLSRIAGQDSPLPPEPISRLDKYLSRLVGEGTELPPFPISRADRYLARIVENGARVDLGITGASAGQVATVAAVDGDGKPTEWEATDGVRVVNVTGTTPTINAAANTRYICGEVATLTITLPASGIVDVLFTSGTTPTVLTITPPTGQTLKWAGGFDPSALDADTTYEINIMDGLGVAAQWT